MADRISTYRQIQVIINVGSSGHSLAVITKAVDQGRERKLQIINVPLEFLPTATTEQVLNLSAVALMKATETWD